MHMVNRHSANRDRVDGRGVNEYSICEYLRGGAVCVHAEDNRCEVIGLDADGFDWFGFD
jgi:hypothetical protein